MAKKKGGGDQESKKTIQKKKAQAIEDKTFGLKNKNKSKKVIILLFICVVLRLSPQSHCLPLN